MSLGNSQHSQKRLKLERVSSPSNTQTSTRINRGHRLPLSRSYKSLQLFLQHPLFLSLEVVNPGNHKQQNTQLSKRIVPWINITFLRISGQLVLIHYYLAQIGFVSMDIIANFTRVKNKIRLCCVYLSLWFV